MITTMVALDEMTVVKDEEQRRRSDQCGEASQYRSSIE